jgi:hypothetical protein
MEVITIKGCRFNKKYLQTITLEKAFQTLTKEPKEVIEEAWNIANGKVVVKKKATKK